MKSFDLTRIQIQHEDPVLAMGLAAVLRRRSDRDVNISGIDPEPNEPPQIVIADHRRAVQLAMGCSDRRERPSLMAVWTKRWSR